MNTHAAETPLHLQARRIRRERRWTQQHVADQAGFSLRTYQLWENGHSNLQPANLRAVVDVLGLEGGEGVPESRWEMDIAAFLNMLGIFLEEMSDRERERFIETETRRIFQQMRAVPATEREEAAEAMQEAMARRAASDPRDIPRESERKA